MCHCVLELTLDLSLSPILIYFILHIISHNHFEILEMLKTIAITMKGSALFSIIFSVSKVCIKSKIRPMDKNGVYSTPQSDSFTSIGFSEFSV